MNASQKKNILLIKAGLKLISIVGFAQIVKTIYNIGKIKRLLRKL